MLSSLRAWAGSWRGAPATRATAAGCGRSSAGPCASKHLVLGSAEAPRRARARTARRHSAALPLATSTIDSARIGVSIGRPSTRSGRLPPPPLRRRFARRASSEAGPALRCLGEHGPAAALLPRHAPTRPAYTASGYACMIRASLLRTNRAADSKPRRFAAEQGLCARIQARAALIEVVAGPPSEWPCGLIRDARGRSALTLQAGAEVLHVPLYLSRFGYTTDAVKALIDQPQDRSAAAREVAESLGGTLVGFWYAFGEFDGVFLLERARQRVGGGAGCGRRRRRSVIGDRDHRSARHGQGPGRDEEGRCGNVPAAGFIAVAADEIRDRRLTWSVLAKARKWRSSGARTE